MTAKSLDAGRHQGEDESHDHSTACCEQLTWGSQQLPRAGWHQRTRHVLCSGFLALPMMTVWVAALLSPQQEYGWAEEWGHGDTPGGWGFTPMKVGAVGLRMVPGSGPGPSAGELCPVPPLGLVSPWRVTGAGREEATQALCGERRFGCIQLKGWWWRKPGRAGKEAQAAGR